MSWPVPICPNPPWPASPPTVTRSSWWGTPPCGGCGGTGTDLTLDDEFRPRYRTLAGQTHGWDAVLALGAAWFLDNGAGSENYAGTLRDQGSSTAPLHLVRVDLDTGDVTLTDVCGRPGGSWPTRR